MRPPTARRGCESSAVRDSVTCRLLRVSVAPRGHKMRKTCLYCATAYDAARNHRIFCSDRCRVRYNREEGLTCFYCGEIANARDHITPVACEGARIFKGKETVNACNECNNFLGANAPYNLYDRLKLLEAKMIQRYKLDKSVPEWAEEELNELGTNLRSHVRGWQAKRHRAQDRLLHLRAIRWKLAKATES